MNIYGQVGPQVAADGTNVAARQDKTAALVAQDAHGRYNEANYRGNVFSVCNSAAQALSLTGTTTYTGLVVYNQPNSGKNLSILTVAFAPTIAETGVGAIIMFNNPIAATVPSLTTTNVANGAVQNNLSGATSSVGKPASAVTLAANPVFMRPLIGIPWVTATGQSTLLVKDEVAGEIIIPPGAAFGIVAVTTAITGIGYISWEEIPV